MKIKKYFIFIIFFILIFKAFAETKDTKNFGKNRE